MRRLVVCCFVLIASIASASNEPIEYRVAFPNRDHHEVSVNVVLRGIDQEVLELRMSRSSPGRYAPHEFAKNVYDVRIFDGSGRRLVFSRPDPHGWNVAGHGGRVEIHYRVFGDRCDGTYLAVDNRHAHMNMPATFMWARGLEDRPIRLVIDVPDVEYRIATQLVPTPDANVFTAPDLDYFLDSPTEVGPVEIHEWESGSQHLRLALHHEGTEAQGRAYAGQVKAIVREQQAIFGELPEFDFGSYTFIADYLPEVDGDGMEHRNSTVLTTSRSLDHAVLNLGTVSHEFFHAWNVERIRPRTLEPFDFERANMSGELWFAEGFTSYYDDLVLARAGIVDLERFAEAQTSVVNAVLNAPGRRFFTPVEMSQRAPFVDAAVSIDPTNVENVYVSYYSYGAVLALGLDLSIRSRFPGQSLDDYMRAMWKAHGRTEIPYDLEDLESVLTEVTEPSFAAEFFDRFVHGSDLPDLETLLSRAGLALKRPDADIVWLGASVGESGGRVSLTSRSLVDSPFYRAGLDRGDVLLEIGDRSLGDMEEFEDALRALDPGDRVSIVFDKRGEKRRAELVLEGDPRIEVVPFEEEGRELSPEVKSFRESWLGSRVATP